MAKHIYVHVGETKDAYEKVSPALLAAAKDKANKILQLLNSSAAKDMWADDFAEGVKALNAAINWFK